MDTWHSIQQPPVVRLKNLADGSLICDIHTSVDPRLARPFLVGFAQSIDLVVVIVAAVMVIGIVLAVMLPELPLRAKSGIQARQEAEVVAAATGAPAQPGAASAGGRSASRAGSPLPPR